MKKNLKIRKFLIWGFIIVIDTVILIYADILAFLVRFGRSFYFERNFADYLKIVGFIILFKVVCLYIFRLYTKPIYKSYLIPVIYILKAMTVSTLSVAMIAYFLRAEAIPRLVLLMSLCFSVFFLLLWRIVAKQIIKKVLGKNSLGSRVVIVGTGTAAERVGLRMLNDPSVDYSLIGFIKRVPSDPNPKLLGYPVIGTVETMVRDIKAHYVDIVVIASAKIATNDISKIFSSFKNKRKGGITFHMTSDLYEGIISHAGLPEKGIPFVSTTSFHSVSIWYPPVKRIIDIIVSLLLLITFSPLLLFIAMAIRLSSPGPAFYVTKRIGLAGKQFVMYKFRTMYEWSSHRRIERWVKEMDKRITPVGKMLRRFRLDELPQLINVLKNDMSLIGPRPESRYYVNRLLKKFPFYSERFNVRPGITGWAQVNFGYAASLEESKEKLFYDIYYTQNQSFELDLLISFKTVWTIVTGKGAQ